MIKDIAKEISKLLKNDGEDDYIRDHYYFNDNDFIEENRNYGFTLHGRSNEKINK